MSKSLQKGILFAVCIALVCALGVTLFIFDGTGGAVTGQEGQASNVAQNKNTTTYTHGSYIERDVPSGVRQVNKGTDFVDAVSKDQDISITGSFELTSAQSFLKKDNNGNISDDPATSGTALVYSGTIYGNGYNITITGSQDNISNNSAVWDCGPNGYGDAANMYGGLVGKLTGQIYDLNVTMKSGTMEKIKGNDGGDRWLDVGVIAGIVDDVNARIENCSVTIPANTQITALKSPISRPGLGQSSAGTQYVRAAGIAAELNNGTIVNCTVTNNGCISAGLQENKDDNSITNGYYGAAANAVAWVNNGTLNNIIVKGSGKLIGLKTAAISVVNNSNNSPTTNAYNGYTGTYEFRHGDDGGNWSTASMYVSGARQAIANFYQASNATTRGGANKDQTSHELANSGTTLTVNPSTYTIYFDPTKSSDDTRLAVLFNNENYSAGAEYELYGASRQISNAQISGANGKVLARNLTASPDTWNSGNNFTASVQIAFNPTSYAKLTKYDHGYVDPDNRTTNGTAIGTGEAFEAVFSPSGTITSGVNYHLTNDIVITGFTGKEFSATLDGNGHTIFITGANTCAAQHIGGIVGTLTGTIKNVRVVLVNSVTANTSVSNANVGLGAGHINGGSLINVSVDIPTNVTLSHVGTANDSSLGGIAGSAVSGATFTNVTMNFNGTLSNTRNNDYWPYTSAFVGKPYFKDSANSSANCATFNNIIIRGNGTFASQSNSTTEPPYYAAIGIIQHKGVTDSTAAVYNVNGLIYDFNPQFANDQGATTGNHGACYGLFVNNNNNNATQVQYYDRLVNYGSNGVYNASGAVIEAYAFNENGNAPVPNPSKIKNITETVTNVTGSAVKAYFMPGDSASENLTLVASASNWNGVTQLQLDGAAPAVTSADDGSDKVVNVAKSTAVNISGENLTLSPYNPYTVITASLVTDTKVYDGDPFEAQVSFDLDGGDLSLTEGQYTITYTDGKATGETNANVGDGTYSLTVTLTGTASDGTQYVFDAQGTKTKTFTYTITPFEVTGTWSVNGLKITYGDAAPDYDQYISIELTNEGTIPGGLTGVTANGFTANYVQGTTQAGNTVTISGVDFDITEEDGIIAGNYTLNITAGTETTVEVQKRELTISESFGDSMGHITDNYGENVTTFEALADLFEAEGMSYVEGLYGSDVVTFTVTALTYDKWYNNGADGAWEFNADASSLLSGRLYGNTAYNVGVELASDNSVNDNYELTNSIFVYAILPLPITVTGVELDGFDGDYIYDGNAHNISVTYDGALQGDELTFGISVSYGDQPFDGTALTNAGEYTIDVSFDPQNAFHGEVNYNYDIGVDGSENTPYTLTISPKTLTPTDIRGTFTEYTSFNLPTGASFVTSGILESDSGVSVAVTWGSNAPADSVVGSGSYVAVNTYTANLAIQDDTNNNYTLSADTATFTIKPYNLANATITVEASGLVYDGTEKTATVTVKAGEADITDLVTITGNTETNAGNDYTVSISSKDSNTTGSQKAGTTWSIAKATITIAGTDALTSEYSGEAVDPADLLSDTYITVSGAASGENVYSMLTATSADGEILNYNEGGYTITIALDASVSGSANYQISGSNTITYTIQKKAVTITWSAGDIILGTEADQIRVTHDDNNGIVSGEEYTFTVDNDYNAGTAQVGTQVTFSNPRVTFTVGDENNYSITFNPADQIQVSVVLPNITITVTQATVSVDYLQGYTTQEQFMNNFVLGDAAEGSFTIQVSVSGGSAVQLGSRLDVNSYTVTISSDDYKISEGSTTTYTYEVTSHNLSDVVVTATAENFVYNGSAQTATVTVMAGDENITSLFSVSGNSQTNAGNHNVQVTARTPGNFTGNFSASSVTNWSIAQLPVQISWSAPGSLVYNGQAHTLTATVKNAVNSDDITATVQLTGDNIDVTADGFTYAVTALAGAAANNYTINGGTNITSSTLHITPATINVSGVVWDNASGTTAITYDGAAHNVHIIYTGVVGSETYSFNIQIQEEGSSVPATITNAGNYSVAVTADQNNANYTLSFTGSASQNSTLTINPITLTIGNISGTFTQYTAAPAGSDFITSGSILGVDSAISVSVAWDTDPGAAMTNGFVNADTYNATLSLAGDTHNNYSLSATSATFTVGTYNITNATIVVNEENAAFTYDGTLKTVSVKVLAGAVDITSLVTLGGHQNTNAGENYQVTVSSNSDNLSGTTQTATATWSIAKADYVMTGVTFDDATRPYDGTAQTITVSGTLPTGADGVTVQVNYTGTNGTTITNVGSIQITANFTTTSTNYNTPAAKTATLTIEKKAVTVTWKIGDIIQGTDPDKVKATAEVTNNGGILDGDEYTFTVTLPLKDGSGDYTTTTPEGTVISVTPSLKFTDPTDEGNYDITYNPEFREWTVQLPEVKISLTAPTVEKTYAAGFVTEADFLSNFTGIFTATDAKADLTSANFDITITKQGEVEPTPVGRLDVGTYTVTISAAADSQYTIATDSTFTYTYTVTAEQWTAIVAAPGDGLTYNGLDQLSSLVITPGEANNSCDGAPTIAAVVTGGEMKNAGTYTVTLQLQTAEGAAYEGGNFVLTADSAQIEIAKLKVEIEWEANGDLVYNGQAHTLTATITNKVETDNVTAIVEKHSGDNINVAEGGFAFTIIGLENNDLDNYTIDGAENLISQAFNIIPATLTVEGKEGATLSREYDGNTTAANSFLTADFLTVTGNAPSDDIYAMLNATVAAEKTILNADTYTVTITFNAQAVGASNYDGAEINVALTYTVNRKVITVTFGDYENLTYTASAHQITATVTDSINNDVTDLTGLVAISGTGTSALNAGNYTATVSKTAVEGAYDNYTLASDATQKFTIAQATLTLTEKEGASLSKVYDGKVVDPQSLLTPVNVTVAGMQNGEDAFELGILSIAPEADSEIKSAAGYKLTVSVNEGNYTADDLELTYTVTAKLIGVEWSNTQFTYDGAVHKPTATAKNLVGDETLTLTVTGEQTNASESPYTATVAKSSVTGNYMLEEDATVEFTIAPKPISVEWSNTTLTYNGSEQKPNAAIAAGALIGDDKVEITVEGAQINANTDGAYTATAVITGGDDRGNYTLDSTATTSFTIAPATLNVSVAIAGDGVADNKLTWNVEAEVTVSGNSEDGWTLTSGGTSYIVTVTGADGVASDVLQLTLNGSEYTGTPYGTRVQNGELGVASTNPNYKVVATPIIINIEPDISIEINTGAEYPDSAVYSKDKTYTADDFAGYFSIDGQPEGTWAYSVEGVESGSFSNVGTYTVKATFTITASSIQLENHFTFNITQATVTGVVLNGGGAYTYGGLKAGDTVSVKVTYSDGNTATVNAGFEAAASTGGYVNAGNRVTLTLGSAADEDPNYESVAGQTITDLSIAKKDITAEIFYAETEAVKGVLTLPYNGSEGYVISARPVNVLDGDGVDVTVETEITNAATYSNLSLVLGGNDAANYNLTGTDSLSVVVNPVQAEVNWTVGEYTYNGSAQQPEASATGVNEDVALNITITSDTTDGAAINAGSYTATASTTNTNYTLTNTTCEFTIGKANVSLSIADYDNIKNKVYDGNAVTITPNAVFAGTQTEATGAAALVQVLITDITDYDNPVTADAVKNAGAYTVELRLTEGGENINFANASAYFTFTVTKAELDVTTTALVFSYGDIVNLGASVTALGDDVVTVEIESIVKLGEPAESIDDFTNADRGNYTVTFALAGEDAGNYTISEATATANVRIDPKTITSITWEKDATFTYNGTAQMPDYTVDGIEGLNLDERVVITFGEEEVESAINAGAYTVTIKAFDDGGNYVLKQDYFTDFTIARKQVEITWTGETFTYNGSAQAPTFEVNWVQGDELELTAAITGNVTDGKAINAGDYTATIAAFTQGNYTLASASTKTFTIDKANLTLTPASVTFSEKDADSLAAYSEDSYEATIKDKVTVTGVVGKIADYTVTPEATFTEGLLGVGAHTFTITAGDNYNTATFTVIVTAQQTITITATPSSGTYTGEEITFEYEPSDLSVDISGLTITVATVNGSADGAVLNAGSYTVTFTVNSDDADYLYVVSDWSGSISPATVTANADTAVYGDVYTAQTGGNLQNDGEWQFVTFNGSPVEVNVTVTDATARAGETYLGAGEHTVIVTLVSGNFMFAGGSRSVASTLQITPKQLNIAAQLPEDLTYTSEGIVIGLEDYASQLVGDDKVTVTMLVDGKPYVAGVTVLGAGQHTVTVTMTDTSGNYQHAAAQQTFTIAPKEASDSITVSGETVESGGTVEITTGENLRVDTAINNYIAQNGVAEGEYTVTATDSQGNEVDIDRVSSWAPGDYTISVNLGENFSGGEMTFTISVAEGTTTEIPDPPTTPSTPIVDDGGSGNNWLFPLIIAIECVIALALIAAIVITAIKRSKNA